MNQLASQNNHLLNLFLDDSKSQLTINLSKNIYVIGRHSSCAIKSNSHSVSRHHATLIKKQLPTGEYFYIIIDGDLEGQRSRNGTFVNDKKIINHRLEDGDVILFGDEKNKAVYQQAKSCQRTNPSAPKSETNEKDSLTSLGSKKLHDTLILSEENLKDNLENKDIQHLASFPELSPNPILEFDIGGNLIYRNPAADVCFQEILHLHKNENPLLVGLEIGNQQLNGELLVRELQFAGKFYEQYIHYLSKGRVIRCYIFDITVRKNTEEKLKYQAFHDSVTDIPNREFFYFQLKRFLKERKKSKKPLAILFIDIDRFKNVNDTLSHTIGDKLLKSFAYRLISHLPSDYFLARWGGDEFVVIAPLDSNLVAKNGSFEKNPTVQKIAEIIVQSVKEPFIIEQHKVYITCSIGIATYPDNGLNEKQLIKYADIALYRAKKRGRNNYQFYLTQFNREQTLLFKLEHNLYSALEKKELFLTFQPKLDLKQKCIKGAEVLLRWLCPDQGIISPGLFIPIAEEAGLIASIGKWVLETACIRGKRWQDMGYPPFTLAVNVSTKQFQTDNFLNDVKDILEHTQFPPEYLELEVTESILMEDVSRSEYIIHELSSMGVNFSLDDFGTGYSSLAYLKRFPFHSVKIDKSFIDDLVANEQDQALVSAVITIAKSYNMIVVAEGVETDAQKQILEDLECETIQGWLVSKPLMETEFLSLLEKHKS